MADHDDKLRQTESSDPATPVASDVAGPAACARAPGTSAARPFRSVLDTELNFETEDGYRALISMGEIATALQRGLSTTDLTLGALLAARDFADQRLYLAIRSGHIPDAPLHELACRYVEHGIQGISVPIDTRCVRGLAVKRAWVRGEVSLHHLAEARRASEHVARHGSRETSHIDEAAWVATWPVAADASWLAARAVANGLMWSMATTAVWMTVQDANRARRTAWLGLMDLTWEYLAQVPLDAEGEVQGD